MEEPQSRPRTMLSDQLSAAALDPHPPTSTGAAIAASSSSSNLRELLTVRQEEDLQPPLRQLRRGPSMSMGTVLACENRDLSSFGPTMVMSPSAAAAHTGSRTLFDIIRAEEESVGGRGRAYDGVIIRSGGVGGHKISWRSFKDRLRIRRAGTAWQSGTDGGGDGGSVLHEDISVPDLVLPPPAASYGDGAPEAGGVAEQNPSSSAVEVTRPPTPAVRIDSFCGAPPVGQQVEVSNRDASGAPATASSGEAQEQPQQIRVSLMALLEETDRQGDVPGFAVSALLEAAGEVEPEEEEEDEEGGGGGGGGKMYVKCCVCMVRHKGAAFIPCGHTFCRLCSRELWVSRGNCPLCNGFILEILDIF